MRVTNDVRSYISKEVWAKAESKYNALKDNVKKIKKEFDDECAKFYDEQKKILAEVSRRLVPLAKKHGLTVKDNKSVISGFTEYSFVESYNKPEPLRKAEDSVSRFANDVEHAIHGIIFKLEAGGKASDILKMIEEVKF